MSALIKQEPEIDYDVIAVLESSLYPGAKRESIEMIIECCKASKINPLLKPYHIVPMSVKDPKTGKYEYKDSIWPGIGLYRIMAERSGCYAGISEPKFGPMVTQNFDGINFSYPEWCTITVKRIVQGNIVEFVNKEYWIENYATQKHDTSRPNKIWVKRPFGQLAKCTESQGLKKTFPDIIPQQPTAEEMEGKIFVHENERIDSKKSALVSVGKDKFSPWDENKENLQDGSFINHVEKKQTLNHETGEITPLPVDYTKFQLSDPELHGKLMGLIVLRDVQMDEVNRWTNKAGVDSIAQLTNEQRSKLIDMLEKRE